VTALFGSLLFAAKAPLGRIAGFVCLIFAILAALVAMQGFKVEVEKQKEVLARKKTPPRQWNKL
jgi:hypothetical protein